MQYQQQRVNIHQVGLANTHAFTRTHTTVNTYTDIEIDASIRAHTASIPTLRGNQIQEGIHSSVAIGGVTPLKRKRNKPIVTTYWIVHTVVFFKITQNTVSISIFGAKWFGLSAADIFRRLSAKTTRIWIETKETLEIIIIILNNERKKTTTSECFICLDSKDFHFARGPRVHPREKC